MFSFVRNPHKLLFIGGLLSSLILVGFGIASIVIGYQGRQEVRDTLAQENIVTPADASQPNIKVVDGASARVQADIMRHHALTSSGGLTYAQMGSYLAAANPKDPAGTSDKNLALKDANGSPVANSFRNTWVTETALTTALNTAYFAENVGLFAIVMGTALVLSGVGFSVLTVGAYHFGAEKDAQKKAAAAGNLALQS